MAAMSSETSMADPDKRNTASTDLCCAPRAPAVRKLGVRASPAQWHRRP